MILAVLARTLKAGATFADFIGAWAPDDRSKPYPAAVDVGLDPADERRVITVVRFDGSLDEFQAALPDMVRPDAPDRLQEVVESTQLEGVDQSFPSGLAPADA